jgi:hypothetical protein
MPDPQPLTPNLSGGGGFLRGEIMTRGLSDAMEGWAGWGQRLEKRSLFYLREIIPRLLYQRNRGVL